MNKVRQISFFLFISCGTILSAASAAPTNMQTSNQGNVYAADSNLILTSPVAADLFAAGGRINIEGAVGADAAVAGGSVTISAPVQQDLRVAGGSVDIANEVGGELVAAGGTVNLTKSSLIAGSAWLAGSDVRIAGKVGKGTRIYANTITISGEIDGDAYLTARQITLMPGTKISGNLSYASPRVISQDPSVQVLGTVTREPMPEGWDRVEEHEGRSAMLWVRPLFILGMLATGLLLYMIFPMAALGPQQAIRAYPVRSLLFGLALMFTIPPLAILFMVTVIGIPIGFMLLLLYPLTLMFGYLATAFLVGRQIATSVRQPEPGSLGRQALYLGLALIVLSVASAIPFLGGLVVLAAIVVGLGGWAVWIQTSNRQPSSV